SAESSPAPIRPTSCPGSSRTWSALPETSRRLGSRGPSTWSYRRPRVFAAKRVKEGHGVRRPERSPRGRRRSARRHRGLSSAGPDGSCSGDPSGASRRGMPDPGGRGDLLLRLRRLRNHLYDGGPSPSFPPPPGPSRRRWRRRPRRGRRLPRA
ncbi:unnamed protein product, partial [Ixodes hexagonus]